MTIDDSGETESSQTGKVKSFSANMVRPKSMEQFGSLFNMYCLVTTALGLANVSDHYSDEITTGRVTTVPMHGIAHV